MAEFDPLGPEARMDRIREFVIKSDEALNGFFAGGKAPDSGALSMYIGLMFIEKGLKHCENCQKKCETWRAHMAGHSIVLALFGKAETDHTHFGGWVQ